MTEITRDADLPTEIIDPQDEQKLVEEKVPEAIQKRINKEVRKTKDAQRAADDARAEAAALRLQIEQSRGTQAQERRQGQPDPNNYPAGKYDADYLEALTDWKVNDLFEKQQKAVIMQQNKSKHSLTEKEVAKKYGDFEDAKDAFRDHNLSSVAVFNEILDDTDNRAEIEYYLGKNPKELDKLSDMTASQAMRYIGRIESIIESKSLAATKKTAPNAPDPITPLSGTRSSAVNKDPADMTMDEYAAWRKQKK